MSWLFQICPVERSSNHPLSLSHNSVQLWSLKQIIWLKRNSTVYEYLVDNLSDNLCYALDWYVINCSGFIGRRFLGNKFVNYGSYHQNFRVLQDIISFFPYRDLQQRLALTQPLGINQMKLLQCLHVFVERFIYFVIDIL